MAAVTEACPRAGEEGFWQAEGGPRGSHVKSEGSAQRATRSPCSMVPTGSFAETTGFKPAPSTFVPQRGHVAFPEAA